MPGSTRGEPREAVGARNSKRKVSLGASSADGDFAAGKPRSETLGKKKRVHTVIRAEWQCRLCGIHGEASNEFTGNSPHAAGPQVVIARGTLDKPRGDECLKCVFCWCTGGWREEFNDDIAAFCVAKDKDDNLNDAWTQSTTLWLEAHNSGKRVREIKSTKYAKRYGQKDSIWEKIKCLRVNRKRVTKTRGRMLRAKIHMKFLTPDAFFVRYKRTLEDEGKEPGWHVIKGVRRWGVIVNMTPDGEVDLSDEEFEGVAEEEEIESGEDMLRDGQAAAKFQSLSNSMDATLKAALTVALEPGKAKVANPKAQAGTDDEDSDDSSFELDDLPDLVKFEGTECNGSAGQSSRPAAVSSGAGRSGPAQQSRSRASAQQSPKPASLRHTSPPASSAGSSKGSTLLPASASGSAAADDAQVRPSVVSLTCHVSSLCFGSLRSKSQEFCGSARRFERTKGSESDVLAIQGAVAHDKPAQALAPGPAAELAGQGARGGQVQRYQGQGGVGHRCSRTRGLGQQQLRHADQEHIEKVLSPRQMSTTPAHRFF